MKQDLKLIALATLYIVLLYAILLQIRPFYLGFSIQYFSNRTYQDDLSLFPDKGNNLVLIVYSIVSLYLNRKTLKSTGKEGKKAWGLNWLIDLFLIPLGVLIMVIYKNLRISSVGSLSSLENIFLMWIFLSLRHMILLPIYKKSALLWRST